MGSEAGREVETLVAGRYEIRSLLGTAPHRRAYRAIDRKANAHVVLKVIETGAFPPAGVRLRSLAEVGKEGVRDVGHLPNGSVFVASEPFEARSLEDELAASGALEPARAVKLLVALCQTHRAELAAGARLRLEPSAVFTYFKGSLETARVSAYGLPGLYPPLEPSGASGTSHSGLAAPLVAALGQLLYTMLVGGPLVVRYGVVEAPSAVNPRYMLSAELDRAVLQAVGYGSGHAQYSSVDSFLRALQATPEARVTAEVRPAPTRSSHIPEKSDLPPRPAASATLAPPAASTAPPVASSAPPVASSAPPVASSAPPVASSAPPAASSAPPVASSAPPAATLAASAASPACPNCGKPNALGVHYCAGCGLDLLRLAQPAGDFSPATTRADALLRMSSSLPPPSPTSTALALSSFVPPATVTEAPPKVGPGAPEEVEGGIVLTMFPPSGRVIARLALPASREVTIGIDSDPTLRADPEIEPRHATFVRRGNRLFVRDAGTERGVYWKLAPNEPWLLESGQTFRIGNELVRFDDALASEPGMQRAQPFVGHLSVIEGINAGEALALPLGGVQCGRESGELRFPKDPFVSNRHCKIHCSANGLVYLTDVGSTNGTFVRLTAEHPLRPGDVLRLGLHFFRVDF